MAYQVIARKWRPQTFADVVGQQHIIKTLQSELLQDRMAHAYLFVGPRGIGKTTIARIFAKAMNCHKAPTAEPCCECPSCQAIADGNCLDLIEIDGASNNSVDDIRQLREEVLYSPVSNRFKVYIIDEVHMLSTSAWNALLKTIEEPPAHAKFLFATTEAHKVLATVVSRCQRFDLQRISLKLISQQLKKIAASEKISVEDEAIEVISRAADGGMRDAQSLLDQMTAFASADNATITAEQALAVFGLTGVAEMEKLITAILNNDKPGLISGIHQISRQGKNLEKLFDDILAFLRGVQICSIVDDPFTILETGEEMIQLYQKIAASTDAGTVQKLLEHLSPVSRSLHDALNKQVFLETILLKGMRIAHAVEIDSLIARLNQLRKGESLGNLNQIPSGTIVSQPSLAPAPVAPLSTRATTAASPVVAPTPTVQPSPQPHVPGELGNLPSLDNPVKKNEGEAHGTPLPEAELRSSSPLLLTPKVNEEQKIEVIQPPSPPVEIPVFSGLTDVVSTPKAQEAEKEPFGLQQTPAATAQVQSITQNKNIDNPVEFDNNQPSQNNVPISSSFNFIDQNQPAQNQIDQDFFPKQNIAEKLEQKIVRLENPKPEISLLDRNSLSPESVWHSLILEMDHCKQPILKAYMQEGRPESLIGATLTVVYDEDSEAFYVSELEKEKNLLELRMKKITGLEGAHLNFISKKGVVSPRENIHQRVEDLAEVRKRAESNQFVKDTIDLFNGEIVDVRG